MIESDSWRLLAKRTRSLKTYLARVQCAHFIFRPFLAMLAGVINLMAWMKDDTYTPKTRLS